MAAKPGPESAPVDGMPTPAGYWASTLHTIEPLLAVWFAMTLGVILFARPAFELNFFGWPMSFYMAAQGLPLMYLLLIYLNATRMRRLEKGARQPGPPDADQA